MNHFFLSLIFICFSFSQDYLWPTDASKVLTSSYAESRSDRFHTGIDFTTWNKEGYHCIAIADGYVYRVVTGVYGYGRAIYIKLNDGKFAVYAHTQKFREDINNYVREVQNKQKKYKQDLYFKPNQFPVAKGDTIAFTGSTGIGVPHLHFEIRNHLNETINPLLFYPDFRDRKFPTISRLILTALDSTSSISDSLIVAEFSPTQMSRKVYELDTISAFGNIGFSVDVSDPTIPERRISTGVHKIELFVDDSLRFKTTHDTIRFSENYLFNLDRDHYAKKYLDRRAQRLHLKKGNLFTYTHLNKGAVSLKKIHHYSIKVSDFKGNTTVLNGVIKIQKGEPKQPLVTNELLKTEPVIWENKSYNSGRNDSLTTYWYKGSVNIYEGKFLTYRTPKNGLFENTYVREEVLDRSKFPVMNYESEIVYLNPMQLEFRYPLEIQTATKLPENVGVFRWNRRKQRWDYENARKLETGKLRFKDNSVRIHALIKDTIPPSIRFTKWDPESDSYFIYVKDDVSGIYNERNFKIFSGSNQIIGEYDFEDDRIKIDKRDIIRGDFLKIQLKDNLGNEHERKIYINENY